MTDYLAEEVRSLETNRLAITDATSKELGKSSALVNVCFRIVNYNDSDGL